MTIHRTILTLALLGLCFSGQAQTTWPPELIITPERSNFIKTSTYAEVMQVIQQVTAKSNLSYVTSMGKSQEGKNIPLIVLANPQVSTPAEAKASGKPVIYIQGNIHAGEVEGKEALLMLLRDILLGQKKDLLDNQIVLFAPIYNTDSNDKMAQGLRPSQEDSPLETGLRENSQGLDLNRDGIKHEAFETQALFASVINAWDPQVFVDLHTTNGTWHAYSLTWAPSYHSAGEQGPYSYTKDKMLRAITGTIHDKYGMFFGPYGDYDLREGWPVKNFYTYNHHPRYLVNQFGLRNRMAILSEAFAHERFYQRIHSTYTFVYEILSYTNTHGKEIISVNKQAEADAIKLVTTQAGIARKGVRFKMVSQEKLQPFRTYDYVGTTKADGKPEWLRTGKITTYNDVNYFGAFEATQESTVPRGYIIPAKFVSVAEHLRKLGITVQQLAASKKFSGEVFHVEKLEHASRKFEGHFMSTATGSFTPATQSFKKGDYYVDMAQPLANLIFYVLEPQSDDGLVTWNFFDAYLEQAGINNHSVDYPVFKYFK